MLARVAVSRPAQLQRVCNGMHRQFLLGTIGVVWIEHRAVFEAAGYDFRRFRNESLVEFSRWKRFRLRPVDLRAGKDKTPQAEACATFTSRAQKSTSSGVQRVAPET
jgi:hypothetical protein